MARINGPRKVYRYSAEFKGVKLSDLAGVQVKDVAEALDIHCRGAMGIAGGLRRVETGVILSLSRRG